MNKLEEFNNGKVLAEYITIEDVEQIYADYNVPFSVHDGKYLNIGNHEVDMWDLYVENRKD